MRAISVGEALADLAPHQARRGRHDDQLREDLSQLDGPLVAPRLEVALRLVDHLGHHVLERLGVHRVDEQLDLLKALVEGRVVDDALAEDGDRESIHGRLVEHLVLLFDEGALGVVPNHHRDALRPDADGKDGAVALAQPVEHRDGATHKGEQVAHQSSPPLTTGGAMAP